MYYCRTDVDTSVLGWAPLFPFEKVHRSYRRLSVRRCPLKARFSTVEVDSDTQETEDRNVQSASSEECVQTKSTVLKCLRSVLSGGICFVILSELSAQRTH